LPYSSQKSIFGPNASKDRAAYEIFEKIPNTRIRLVCPKVETNVGQLLEQGMGAHRLSNRVYS